MDYLVCSATHSIFEEEIGSVHLETSQYRIIKFYACQYWPNLTRYVSPKKLHYFFTCVGSPSLTILLLESYSSLLKIVDDCCKHLEVATDLLPSIFVIVGLLVGLAALVIIPPIQVADESFHLFRSFQVSEGKWIAIRNQRTLGGMIPRGLREVSDQWHRGLRNSQTGYYDFRGNWRLRNHPLQNETPEFVNFPSPALYSPVLYLPQALGMRVARLFSMGPWYYLYFGRLGNLLFSLILGFIAIRLLPQSGWLFFLVLMTPTSLFQRSSLSCDALINSVGLLMIAIALNMAVKLDRTIKIWELIICCILSFVIAQSKSTYLFLPFIFFIVSPTNFRTRRGYRYALGSVALSSVVGFVLWNLIVRSIQVPLTEKGNSLGQIAFCLANPWLALKTIGTELYGGWGGYLRDVVGEHLGWRNVVLPRFFVAWYVNAMIFCSLFALTLANYTFRKRVYTLALGCFSYLFIGLAVYLVNMHVGAPRLEGIQGRYLTPILPLFFLPFLGVLGSTRVQKLIPAIALGFMGWGVYLTFKALLINHYLLS